MELRYYMGRHKVEITEKHGKKSYIMHLESGYVGYKGMYKDVNFGDFDIVPTRLLYRNKKVQAIKKEEKKKYIVIKIHKGIYDSLKELRKVLIIKGWSKLPKDLIDYLKKNDCKYITESKMTNATVIEMLILTVKYLGGYE